jgi:hypothetical protein
MALPVLGRAQPLTVDRREDGERIRQLDLPFGAVRRYRRVCGKSSTPAIGCRMVLSVSRGPVRAGVWVPVSARGFRWAWMWAPPCPRVDRTTDSRLSANYGFGVGGRTRLMPP